MSLTIFARNLRHLRKQKKWSQEQASRKLFVSRSMLSLLEAGKQDLPYRKLKVFGKVYEVDIIVLMEIDIQAA